MATKHKHERFEEFLKKMQDATPASKFEEARNLLTGTLNAVEDEWSGVPYDPASWQADGRMYPPEDDSSRDVPGKPLVKRFRSKGHNTYIGLNGAIEIRTIANEIVFEKTGLDGRGVWEQ